MNEIAGYFKEKWNKSVFEKRDLENKMHIIDNEMIELDNQERSIHLREDSPDYVFQVECFERNMDEKTLDSITQRRSELLDDKKELELRIEEAKVSINKFKKMYDQSVAMHAMHTNNISHDNYARLEFILKLMDNDIQRAKIELANFLKEEKVNAD